MIELLGTQLTDPFRIGLIFFLLVTAVRTRHSMGMRAPLAMGVVFVAILLPLTTEAGAVGATRLSAVLSGILANAVILAVFLAGWTLWERRSR
ncbi:hypothetical protein J2858_000872 [Neorhizobium galegae]|uniref:hypothetical protein n=1 Tax=Rhizobium/Agrobacterium group TaxID=227290 RepID=UPI001AE3A37C|nr:hypothetical protein [Neorhizobium galegae]MBP2547979.1 hypothetical protein [Neorhizobium galegae]